MSDSFANGSRIVVVEGLVGVGKTTFIKSARLYAVQSGAFDRVLVVGEPIKPRLLSAYLRDEASQRHYALLFQHNIAIKLKALYERAKKQAAETARCLVLIDRGMAGNQSFAKVQLDMGFFSDEDYELYREEIGDYDGTLAALRADKAFNVIYLRCQPETAFARMQKRGFDEEVKRYDAKYFRALFEAHEEFVLRELPTVVEWDDDEVIENGTLCERAVQTVLQAVVGK